jgi:hypothetical protein
MPPDGFALHCLGMERPGFDDKGGASLRPTIMGYSTSGLTLKQTIRGLVIFLIETSDHPVHKLNCLGIIQSQIARQGMPCLERQCMSYCCFE